MSCLLHFGLFSCMSASSELLAVCSKPQEYQVFFSQKGLFISLIHFMTHSSPPTLNFLTAKNLDFSEEA